MSEFSNIIDAIIEERSLLKHPFYQAWNAGTLPLESLREYARQYFHFEAAFPTFLSAVHARMQPGAVRQAVLTNLWDEEHGNNNHLAMWLRFCESLGLDETEVRASEPNAETRDLVDGFRAACSRGGVEEGLATLYAYESQAPRVAGTKIAGLRRFYGFDDPKSYEFFSVHQDVDVDHSATERNAIVAAATTTEARAGLEEATRSAADRLWRFLDGAYAGVCG
ncbi:MAG TPA: CADD family putative folate metabolism protein [Dehalococcoidia bacterium]|nr:CADD family putative folate metabolism protein [Dehalococcoidia bacterium]